MKIERFNEKFKPSNRSEHDEITQKLSSKVREQMIILDMAISGFGKVPLEKIDIEKIIEKLKKLKKRLDFSRDVKKYNL